MAPTQPTVAFTSHRWFYNTVGGSIIHITNTAGAAVQNILPGWKGFNTEAEAEAYKKANPPSIPIIGGIGDAVSGAGSTLTDLNGFVSALSQRATWLRVGEGVLGIILIGIGVSAMARNSSTVKSATKAAKFLI